MNYNSLNKALKYATGKYTPKMLSTMTYHDFAGDHKADHTKRGILADEYEEHTGDTEGANLLRKEGQPVTWHENKIQPAVLRSIVTMHPIWVSTDDRPNFNALSQQEYIDFAHNWHKDKDTEPTGESARQRQLLADINTDGLYEDKDNRGYVIVPSDFTADRVVRKRIVAPLKPYNYVNPFTNKFGHTPEEVNQE